MRIKDGFSGQRQIAVPSAGVREMEQHPTGKDLHITDIGFYPKAAHHYRERPHGGAEHIFIYCTNGQGWVEISGNRRKVRENQFFIVPLGAPHSYGAAALTPWTIYWIHFKGEKALPLAAPLMLSGCNSIEVSERSRIGDRLRLFEEIYAALDNGFTGENMLYAGLCLHHFLGTLLYVEQFRHTSIGSAGNDAVDLVIHYMRENMEKDVSMSDLVDFSGYSTSQLNNIFKQRTGLSPKQYYLQLKIREACKYLNFTDMKVNQLCYKVGVQDPLYFSRLFTKVMGCSPSEYRCIQKG
ncbi:MAG: AraC family transcriptional regulator [Prevotellaceae bacterium]|jgi:AraC-like DNA-binding protein/quercetin dioxygenase-like cupin family protein|nr:AraC family transcriptional regulator [Prevotellaceae bacterium]